MSCREKPRRIRSAISTFGLGQDGEPRLSRSGVAALANGQVALPSTTRRPEQNPCSRCDGGTRGRLQWRSRGRGHREAGRDSDGRRMETAPALRGFVRFITKPRPRPFLSVMRKRSAAGPLAGELGEAAVFTSDAKAREGGELDHLAGLRQILTNVTARFVATPAAATEATSAYGQRQRRVGWSTTGWAVTCRSRR